MSPTPTAVADTSALQYLFQLGHLDLLRHLYMRVLVPRAVERELEIGRRDGRNVPVVASIAWLEVISVSNPLLHLDPGEAEVIAAAQQRGILAVLDDRAARRAAEALGVAVTGTLGILIEGKRRGLIPAVEPEFDRLVTLGFRLTPATRRMALELAGE